MIERKDVMPVNFLKKENFTGSYKGMRYRMEKAVSIRPAPEEVNESEEAGKETNPAEGEKDAAPAAEVTVLRVTAWPEPYCFDATPDEQKIWKEFPFTEEGIVSGVEWLNEQYGK